MANLNQRRNDLNARFVELKKRVAALPKDFPKAKKAQITELMPNQKIGEHWTNPNKFDDFANRLVGVEKLLPKKKSSKSGDSRKKKPDPVTQLRTELLDKLAVINGTLGNLGGKVDKCATQDSVTSGLQQERDHFDQELAKKANSGDVRRSLEQKANSNDVTRSLEQKVSKTSFDSLKQTVEGEADQETPGGLTTRVTALEDADPPEQKTTTAMRWVIGLMAVALLVLIAFFTLNYISENSWDPYEIHGVQVDEQGNFSFASSTEDDVSTSDDSAASN